MCSRHAERLRLSIGIAVIFVLGVYMSFLIDYRSTLNVGSRFNPGPDSMKFLGLLTVSIALGIIGFTLADRTSHAARLSAFAAGWIAWVCVLYFIPFYAFDRLWQRGVGLILFLLCLWKSRSPFARK